MVEILIIDDEAAVRRLMSRILKRVGHTVHEAGSGGEGIEMFRRLHPALVICDIVMPDIEGIEAIRIMHREDPAVPIIAASGSDVPLYLRAAIGLGAKLGLEKPFLAKDLLAAVGSLVGTAS